MEMLIKNNIVELIPKNNIIIKEKLNTMISICEKFLNFSNYNKEILFIKVLLIYNDKFIRNDIVSDSLDMYLYKLERDTYIENKYINKIQQLFNSYNISFDFSNESIYSFIFDNYEIILQDLIDDILEIKYSKKYLKLKQLIYSTFNDNKLTLKNDNISLELSEYLNNRILYLIEYISKL